jgi:hypothetical protein
VAVWLEDCSFSASVLDQTAAAAMPAAPGQGRFLLDRDLIVTSYYWMRDRDGGQSSPVAQLGGNLQATAPC